MLQSHTEYVTVPPGEVRESLRTSSPVTQSTPGFGVGDLEGDFDGLGDLDGLGDFEGDGLPDGDFDGLGLLEGVVLFDGLGLCDGFGVLLGDGVVEGVDDSDGLADCEGLGPAVAVLDLVAVGRGLIMGVFRPDELGLEALPASGIMLARTACADARPHTALSKGLLGAARTGETAGPDSRNRPAPVATAACPTRTILTGTAALR